MSPEDQEILFLEKRIQRDVSKLRDLLYGGESHIKYGLKQDVSIEILGSAYNDSVAVYGGNMGFTSVGYKPEGLTILVHDDRMREIAQISFPSELLNVKEQQ